MGWLNINGNWIGRHSGKSWQTYWTTQNIFDFYWYEGAANVTATELVDKSGNGNNVTITGKDFATAYIPATSAATFDCPNNATFIADDTDNLWINKNEESRGVEISELIGYDFGRTIVWYDDSAPHHIRAIGILKSTVTLTQEQIDKLHTDFRLPIFWSGVENLNGFVKANRGLAQSVWTAVSEAALDYSDTYQTAVLADGGEIISRKVLESEYQRLIDTGDILTCWYSYHYQCGVKRGDVDYGANGVHNMVSKWYNLSPVAGRFAESVYAYSVAAGTDARPEYTASGLLFRPTNLDGGIRCGLETANSVLTNNNNLIRMRGIVTPLSYGYIGGHGYTGDAAGNISVNDAVTTRKIGLAYRNNILASNTVVSSVEEDVFADGTEVTFELTALYVDPFTVSAKKNGVDLTFSTGATNAIYPQMLYPDLVGCFRSLGRTPYSGYIKQFELFTL